MRIAIATAKLDPKHGGAESWSLGLAKWLADQGQEVHLVGLKVAPELAFPARNIHLLKASKSRLEAARRLAQWLETKHFDIVHDMGLGYQFDIFQPHCGSLMAMERGKTNSFSFGQRLIRKIACPLALRSRRVEHLAALQSSHPKAMYVAVSKMVASDLHQWDSIEKNQIRVIPNGVDTAKYHPERCLLLRSESRAKFDIPRDAFVVSIIAHNHQLKGVRQVLKALQIAKDFPTDVRFLVVGGHRQRYRDFKIGSHQVTFTGAIDGALGIYAASDVYLHPTFYDACCLSVLEAMACGVPAITTKCNGASERIVHGESGLLLDSAKHTKEMIELLALLVDPQVRSRLGRAARQAAESWTIQDNYAAVKTLYSDYLSFADVYTSKNKPTFAKIAA